MSNTSSSGFKYRMDALGMSSNSLLCAYDFTNDPSLNGGYVNPTYWSSGCYTGRLNGSSSSFFQNSGSGYLLSSNSIDILGNIPDDNFSFLFCYEKVTTGSQILLSSAGGSTFSSSSGLVFGINDANNLYLEYWNNIDGKFSTTYPYQIGSKNIVYLNKGFNTFNIGVLNAELSAVNIQHFSILNSNYSHSNRFKIGGNINSYWSSGAGFNGFLDDFYCLSGSFPQDYIPVLSSGFYSTMLPPSVSGTGYLCNTVSVLTGSGIIIGTGITGYRVDTTFSTGYFPIGLYQSGYTYSLGSGVTGYENRYIGDLQDAYGFYNPIYVMTPLSGERFAHGVRGIYTGIATVVTPTYQKIALTGFLTGNTFVPVNISLCSGFTGYYPARLHIDSGFINSLGFDGVYALKSCSTNSTGEVYFYPSGINGAINLTPKYDSAISEYFIGDAYSVANSNLVFRNGHLLLESGYSLYMNGYVQKYSLQGDIFLSGHNIMSSGKNKKTDILAYDYSTGLNKSAKFISSYVSAGSALSNYFSAPYTNVSIFLNGRKLLYGFEYNNSSINIDIPASSVLIKISDDYVSSVKIKNTGLSNLFVSTSRFPAGTSQFYSSGVKLGIDNGYLEVSKLNLLSGCQTPQYGNLLYSSSSNSMFWSG